MTRLDVPTWTNSGGLLLALIALAVAFLAVRALRDAMRRVK